MMLKLVIMCRLICSYIVLKSAITYSIGQFTLRDMYEQFQNIMKMGPFNQIIVSARNIHFCVVISGVLCVCLCVSVFCLSISRSLSVCV